MTARPDLCNVCGHHLHLPKGCGWYDCPCLAAVNALPELLAEIGDRRTTGGTMTTQALTDAALAELEQRHGQRIGGTMEPVPGDLTKMRQTTYCVFCVLHRPEDDPRWPCEIASLVAEVRRLRAVEVAARATPMTDRESLRAAVEALPVTFAAEPFRAAVLALLSEPDTGAGLDVLWADIVKFVRWSANVRDDTPESIAVARALLERIEAATDLAARPAGPWSGDPADYDGDEGR